MAEYKLVRKHCIVIADVSVYSNHLSASERMPSKLAPLP
jgi:hypothetical protein